MTSDRGDGGRDKENRMGVSGKKEGELIPMQNENRETTRWGR